MKINSVHQAKVLNEIIDNAAELPLDSQNLLLMLAKAMQYTHNCIVAENRVNQKGVKQ